MPVTAEVLRRLAEQYRQRAELAQQEASALAELAAEMDTLAVKAAEVPPPPDSWRSKLWTVPPDTRLSVKEAAEALGASPRWIWQHIGPGTLECPASELDGITRIRAGDLRQWIQDYEIMAGVEERQRRLRRRIARVTAQNRHTNNGSGNDE